MLIQKIISNVSECVSKAVSRHIYTLDDRVGAKIGSTAGDSKHS